MVPRGDFAGGLLLLSKAIAINPKEPEFYYQRGNAYWVEKRTELALADFDEVIKLNEGFLPAYIPRAELQLGKDNTSAALENLNKVNQLAPPQADLRLYGVWMDNHSVDSRIVDAWAGRCFSRAMQSQDLPAALRDCETALRIDGKSDPGRSNLWVDRALVRVRLGVLWQGNRRLQRRAKELAEACHGAVCSSGC